MFVLDSICFCDKVDFFYICLCDSVSFHFLWLPWEIGTSPARCNLLSFLQHVQISPSYYFRFSPCTCDCILKTSRFKSFQIIFYRTEIYFKHTHAAMHKSFEIKLSINRNNIFESNDTNSSSSSNKLSILIIW